MTHKNSDFRLFKSAWLLLMIFVVSGTQAHPGHGGLPPSAEYPTKYMSTVFDDVRSIYTEWGSNSFNPSIVAGEEHEYIDTFAGLLQHKYIDIYIPANGGLDIQAQRNYLLTQPHQFDQMTALQRGVNGIGWQMHYGKLVSSTLNSEGVCLAPLQGTGNPEAEFTDLVNYVLSALESQEFESDDSIEQRIVAMKSLLSRRGTFSLSVLDELETLSIQAVHDLDVSISVNAPSEIPTYDISPIVPENDTSALQLAQFFRTLVSGFSIPFTTRDNISLELPDGSRRLFFRDQISNDGSLITQERFKLHCDQGQMVVSTPNGVRYVMSEYERFIGQKSPSEYSDLLYWGENSWYVSSIEDLYGNRVDLDYAQNDLGIKYITQVQSSDDNTHPLVYHYENIDTHLIRVESISSGDKVWSYDYQIVSKQNDQNQDEIKEFNVLSTVTRPDDRVISYIYDESTFQLSKYISAYGAEIEYAYESIDIMGEFPNIADSRRYYSALKSRSISGEGVEPVSWTYQVQPNAVRLDTLAQNSNNLFVTNPRQRWLDKTTITGPYTKTDYFHFGGRPITVDGALIAWSAHLQSQFLVSDTTALDTQDESRFVYGHGFGRLGQQVQVSTHSHSNGTSLSDYFIDSIREVPNEVAPGVFLPVVTGRYVHDSFLLFGIETSAEASYAVSYDNFDDLGFPQTITEILSGVSGPNLGNRIRNMTYEHDRQQWLLGLSTNELISNNEESLTIQREYTDEGQLEESTVAGVITTYTYHETGDLATMTDANGHKTSFIGYKNGRPTSITNPENETFKYNLNLTGTLESVIDARENKTSYEYDGLDRVIKVTPAINEPIIFDYPSDSLIETRTRGDLISQTKFDALGRVSESSAHDIKTTYEYDLANRRVFASLPNSELGSFTQYNAIGQMVMTTDPRGEVERYEYAPNFNAVSRTNKRGFERTDSIYRYGFEAFLSRIEEPYENDQRNTAISYDIVGNRTRIFQSSQNLGQGQERLYTYDDRYFLKSTEGPEIGTTVYSTDAVGNVMSSEVGSSGRVTTYEYDKVNRLKLIDYPLDTDDVSYTYNLNGQLSTSQTGIIGSQYSYDNNNQLIGERMTIGGRFPRDHQLTYEYNELDDLSRIVYPDGYSVDYQPDALGRPTKVGSIASQVQFTDDGQLSSLVLANGKTVAYEFDERLMPRSISTSGVINTTYEYDPQGNVQSISNSEDTTHDVAFDNEAYDGLDRLRQVVTSDQSVGQLNHNYDALGNLQMVATGAADNQQMTQYNTASNLRYVDNSAFDKPDLSLEYDLYGNVTNKKKRMSSPQGLPISLVDESFHYDDASRLLQVSSSSTQNRNRVDSRRYHYDAKKYRVVSEVPNSFDVNYSFYSSSGDLMFEESVETCSTISNIRLGSKLLARRDIESHDARLDNDGDTINNCLEIVFGLNPNLASDAEADNDNDGLSNAQELNLYFTSIDSLDTDQDGLTDAEEISIGTDPNNADTDGDGLLDGEEAVHGTDPLQFDTDHDGVSDNVEIASNLDPLKGSDGSLDLDNDGFSNRQEAQLGFDPSSSASTPSSSGKKEWEFNGLGMALSSPSIDSSGKIYYATDLGNVYAVYPDGSLAWEYKTTGSVYGSLAIDEANQSVIFADVNGQLTVFDLAGQLKWQAELLEPVFGSPGFDAQGNIYVASNTKLWSFDKTGASRWEFTLDGETSFRSRVTMSLNARVLIGDSTGRLYAVDAQTGELVYQRFVTGSLAQSSVVIDNNGSMFFVTSEGWLYFMDEDGNTLDRLQVHELDNTPNVFSTPVIGNNNMLFVGVADNPELIRFPGILSTGFEVAAFEIDGTQLRNAWQYQLPATPSTPALAADGSLYIADAIGQVHAVGADRTAMWVNDQYSGRSMGSLTLGADGTVYIVYENGALAAISNNKLPLQEQWSGLGHGGLMSGHQCQQGKAVFSIVDDTDSDGFPDCYEMLNGLLFDNPSDGNQDSDGDGLSDGQEYLANTNSENPDTDGDGIQDGDEVNSGTNPLDRQPELTINEPSDSVVTHAGATLRFRARAVDHEDGNLSTSIVWSSSIDGQIGVGSIIETDQLSIGAHTIAASVTDSLGSTQQESLSVQINENQAPVIEILSPTTGQIIELGDEVNFQLTAIDPEEGDVSINANWVSSIDGALGIGASLINGELSVGEHQITVQASDSLGVVGHAQIVIEVDFDPLADPDQDGLTTERELELGTNPIQKDTDHDGLHDGLEITLETDPLYDLGEAMADYDNDGFSNRQESATDTDPLDPASKPALGSLMWRTPSYGAIALSDDNVLHSGPSVMHPDGTLNVQLNFDDSMSGRPVIGKSGVKYTATGSSIYKTDLDGIVTTLAEFEDVDFGFYRFIGPSVNDDESVLLVATGAAYDDSEALSVNAQGQLIAKYLNTDGRGFDFSATHALGPDNQVYLAPDEADALHVYNENGDLTQVNYFSRISLVSTIIVDHGGSAYTKLGNFHGDGLLTKTAPDPSLNWSLITNATSGNRDMLLGHNGQLYTQYGSAEGGDILAKINTDTGEFEETTCRLSALGFIGANGLIYVSDRSELSSRQRIIKACDPSGAEIWRSLPDELNSGFSSGDEYVVARDGTLLLSDFRNISAYVTGSGGLANTAWPISRHDNRKSNHQSGVLSFDGARITSPLSGKRLGERTFTLTWSASDAQSYRLKVGSQAKGNDLVDVTLDGAITEQEVNLSSFAGQRVYVTLESVLDGHQTYVDTVAFQAPFQSDSPTASLTSHADGDVLNSSGPRFTWNSVAGADRYRFWFGTTVGANDIRVASAGEMITERIIRDLPLDGSEVYLRFFTRVDGVWTYVDYAFTAHTDFGPLLANLASPELGAVLDSPHVEFTWEAVEGAQRYRLWFGTTPGGNDLQVRSAAGDITSRNVFDLPLDGSKVYVRFFTRKYNQWRYQDYEFVSHTDFSPQVAELTSHESGETWNTPHIQFNWQDINADRYRIWVGSEVGGRDIRTASMTGDRTERLLRSLPHDGRPVFVRLSTQKYGRWQHKDYEFITHTDPVPDTSELISHQNGDELSGETVTFRWAEVGAERHRLVVGTSLNDSDILAQTLRDPAGHELVVSGLPTDGSTIFVNLRTFKYGLWTTIRYEFKAASANAN